MRHKLSKQPSRRQILRGITVAGAALIVPAMARADDDSLQDSFDRGRALRNTDREGNTAAALHAIDTVEPILSYDTAYNLQLAIRQHEQIVAEGGWKEVPRDTVGLVVGNDRRAVRRLRNRLVQSGDMEAPRRGKDLFDENLDAGLRNFQARHGLIVSGKVDPETFFALNVPADYRLSQLRLNSLRVENIAGALSDRYVVVNIPAATIEAIDIGTVTRRHTAIVGRIDRPTPILHSKIHQINFNPYWHVPKSIIRRDLIKYMNEDPEYLTKYRIKIFKGKEELSPTDIDWSTDEAVSYSFRQEPGAENSMGHVKINFHNKHAVYLHDTPTKSLFGENRRFHSSGCVRVENVDAMVAWLLRDNGEEWNQAAVDATFNSGERLDVSIKNPVPILTTYITAWANKQGTVSFRDDVYEFDKAGRVVFDS